MAEIGVGNGFPYILPFDHILNIKLDDEIGTIWTFHFDHANGFDLYRGFGELFDCCENIRDMTFIGFGDISEIVEKTFLYNKKPLVWKYSWFTTFLHNLWSFISLRIRYHLHLFLDNINIHSVKSHHHNFISSYLHLHQPHLIPFIFFHFIWISFRAIIVILSAFGELGSTKII